MLTAHNVTRIREAEDRVMEQIGPETLMQRAAEGLARQMSDIPGGARVLMLIGPGNNGGDALFAATHLLRRSVTVDLCALDPQKVHSAGWQAALEAGAGTVTEHNVREGHIGYEWGEYEWVVDALFGIGARAPLRDRAARLADAVAGTRILAVDVPSGIDVDGGTVPGPAIHAYRTVTFGTYKPGLLISPAAEYAGADLADLVDIGLADWLGQPQFEAIEPGDGGMLGERLFSSDVIHKYTRGVVGVAAGSDEYAGAAHLAVAGAQAGPAGMIRFLSDSELSHRVVDRAPEVVAGRGQVQAWVTGSGGGRDAAETLRSVLSDGVPTVIDADALHALPETFGAPAVLTPHAGELARMLDISRDQVESDPLTHGWAAAERWNATVLLKGKRTCVFTPGEPVRVNLSGTPWLATAGAGDVLAGFIGSLLAAGVPPHDAASIGAYLHGAAAVHANPGGPVVAHHVANSLPHVTARFLDGTLDNVRSWTNASA